MSVVGIPNNKIVSDEALEAAALALAKAACVPHYDGRDMAREALAAAVPYIEAGLREQIAAEIEAAGSAQLVAGSSYRCAVFDGHHLAARVARGTQETPNGE